MTASEANPGRSYLFVDRPDGLRETAGRLRGVRAVGVDTEADSMHCFFEKVCLLQLATDAEPAYLVDPLTLRGAMGELREFFADPGTV